MPDTENGHFETLDPAECLELLRGGVLGRVAFDGPDGLTVLPLAYCVDGVRVVLRTAEGTRLAQLPPDTRVAFEVDDFDDEVRNGWSVLVRGTLRRLAAHELEPQQVPTPFVPGNRSVLLAVEGQELTGRAVSASD